MKTVAIVGPPGAGKTLIATSVAIYLHLASANAVYIDMSIGKVGAKLVDKYVPLAADLAETRAAGADYAVIDAAPYDVPRADFYVVVLEPPDLKEAGVPKEPNVRVVVNKVTSRLMLWREKLAIPFDETIHWAMYHGLPPLVVANVKSWRRLRDVTKEIGDSV